MNPALQSAPQREVQLNATIPYRIVQAPDGTWCGIAQVNTPWGPVTVAATAKPNDEAKRLIAALRAARPGSAQAGFLGKLFKSVVKTVTSPIRATVDIAKKIAQGKIKDALKVAARTVMSTPIAKVALPIVTKVPFIQQALGAALIPFIGPFGPMLVPMALRMAGGLMEQVKRGNPQARAHVQKVVAMARAGNPRARAMIPRLLQANQLLNRAPNFFSLAAQQAAEVARKRAAGINPMPAGSFPGIPDVSSLFAPPSAPSPYAAGVGDAHGQWINTTGGQVFVPNAYAATAGNFLRGVWDQLRPRAGFRPEGQALTLREAYYTGLRASPR